MKLITAFEARERTFKQRQINERNIEEIAQLIQEAIEKGMYMIEINRRIDSVTKKKLVELGYEVTIFDHTDGYEFSYNFFSHSYTTIAWDKATVAL